MNHTKFGMQQTRFPWSCYTNANAQNKTGSNPSKFRAANTAHVTAVVYRTKRQAIQQDFMMRITIDSDSAAEFRHLILNTCGEHVTFMRMQAIAHASRLKVWLCLSKPVADDIIHAIVSALPTAEFGRITPLNKALHH